MLPSSEHLIDLQTGEIFSFRVFVNHGDPEETFLEITNMFEKTIKKNNPFAVEDIKQAFDTYENHSKANIHKDGWNLYHPCKCNDFVLHIEYNTSLKSFEA